MIILSNFWLSISLLEEERGTQALHANLVRNIGRFRLKPLPHCCTILHDKLRRRLKSFIYGVFVFLPIFVMVICNSIIVVHIERVSSFTSKANMIFIFSIFFVFLLFLMTVGPSWSVDYVPCLVCSHIVLSCK